MGPVARRLSPLVVTGEGGGTSYEQGRPTRGWGRHLPVTGVTETGLVVGCVSLEEQVGAPRGVPP